MRDIVPDATGKLWLGTWRGALTFDPAIGASSLTHLGPGNSAINDDFVWDIDRAPDGTMWFANNGSVRYDPATDTWTRFDNMGNVFLAVQPKPTGGYLVWSSSRAPSRDYTFIFDSDTQQWTIISVAYPFDTPNEVVGMPGKDCVDDAGNFWALRSTTPGDFDSLDYRRPNGTWVTPLEPYDGVTFSISAFKAYGDRRAILVDGQGAVYQFNGFNWVSLGTWRPGLNTQSADIDAAGNVWVCGVGGAAKRNVADRSVAALPRHQHEQLRLASTATSRSIRSTTTSTRVPTRLPASAAWCASMGRAGRAGISSRTDSGTTGRSAPTSARRSPIGPSTGGVAVNPYWFSGIHEWTGSGFNMLLPDGGAKRMCEDSLGRLWAIGEYFSLTYYDGSDWTSVPIAAWGKRHHARTRRAPGTVWATTGYEFVRTDGAYRFSRTVGDFPELTDNTDQILGLAADADGVAWVGTTALYDGPTPGGALIRIDADTGAYQMFRTSQGWPFPGDTVTPWAVTPDGRLWMQYDDSNYPYDDVGLCWFDGTNVGSFPAPPGGEPQWGGLPHRQIDDLEVRVIPDGYELWMSCVSRGIAVLTVHPEPTAIGPHDGSRIFALKQNYPNPFNPTTTISFTLPEGARARLNIYDVQGRIVATLVDRVLGPGDHTVQWDAHGVASGVYFCTLESADFKETQKMVLLK